MYYTIFYSHEKSIFRINNKIPHISGEEANLVIQNFNSIIIIKTFCKFISIFGFVNGIFKMYDVWDDEVCHCIMHVWEKYSLWVCFLDFGMFQQIIVLI